MRKKLPILLLAIVFLLQAFIPAVYAASKNEAVASSALFCQFDTPPGGAGNAIQVPGRVQSRINISNEGWSHVVDRHFSTKNASQFTISQNELKSLLQSKDIIKTPVTRTLESADGIRYVCEIDIGKNIGIDKFNNYQPTSTMTVLTDKYGNLVTATTGVIK